MWLGLSRLSARTAAPGALQHAQGALIQLLEAASSTRALGGGASGSQRSVCCDAASTAATAEQSPPGKPCAAESCSNPPRTSGASQQRWQCSSAGALGPHTADPHRSSNAWFNTASTPRHPHQHHQQHRSYHQGRQQHTAGAHAAATRRPRDSNRDSTGEPANLVSPLQEPWPPAYTSFAAVAAVPDPAAAAASPDWQEDQPSSSSGGSRSNSSAARGRANHQQAARGVSGSSGSGNTTAAAAAAAAARPLTREIEEEGSDGEADGGRAAASSDGDDDSSPNDGEGRRRGGGRGVRSVSDHDLSDLSDLEEPHVDDIKLPVKAYHIGGSIDFQRFAADHAPLLQKHQLHRDHFVAELSDMPGGTVLLGRQTRQQAGAANAVRVLAVYGYGSAVFFNSDPDADAHWLERLQAYVRDPHREPLADETTVIVRPSLEGWFALEPDHIVLQALDLSNVRVIASILGQSVALEHFDRRVIAAIERFTPVLSEIASKGVSKLVLPGLFSGLPRQLMGHPHEDELLKLIGGASLLHTDVVYKLGLLHPTDVAWRTDKYYDVWQALHADYGIEKRFEALKAKLGPLLANAKFVLEVREDRKSERSELIIILLIGVEIVLHVAGWYVH